MASLRSRLESIGIADRSAGVRDRLLTATPALAIFTLLGAMSTPTEIWLGWWFYVGLGIFFSGVFFEPFFGTARTCIANALAAIGAFFSADRALLDPLWLTYLVVAVSFFIAAILAAVLPGSSRAKALLNRASTWGTASLLGATALLLEAASSVAETGARAALLAIGTAVLVTGIRLRVSDFRSRAVEFSTPVVVDSIGPNMLLVEGVSSTYEPGIEIVVEPSGVVGTFLGRLPGPFGPRALIALGAEWHSVASRLPTKVSIRSTYSDDRVLGLVGAGSDTSHVRFAVAGPGEIGDPAIIHVAGNDVLYQIASQSLAEYRWDDSRAVLAEATALQVGRVDGGFLRTVQRVPEPFAELRAASAVAGAGLPAGYLRLGVLKGTDFPIGLALDGSSRGHTAVLGMSGMGKTSVAQSICHSAAATSPVIALDITGEYRRNLGFATWTAGDFSTLGARVFEPIGAAPSPAVKAKGFVHDALKFANGEYLAGTFVPRLVCLEEAHSFVPEWSFAPRGDQDASAATASYIMQSRKYGVSFLVVSQRTAVVSKSVLSQCETYVVLRTVDDTSLTYFETIMGPAARSLLPGLARHEALCFGPGINSDGPVVVSLDAPAPVVAVGMAAPAPSAGPTTASSTLQAGDPAPF